MLILWPSLFFGNKDHPILKCKFEEFKDTSADYFDKNYHGCCEKMQNESPWAKNKITSFNLNMIDFIIGPCGHVYGKYKNVWTYLETPDPKTWKEAKMSIDKTTNSNQNQCFNCILRVDHNGNLWFKEFNGIGVIAFYNPVSQKVTYFTKHDYNKIPITYIAFKNGKVFGMSNDKGIFVLQKDGVWKDAKVFNKDIYGFEVIEESDYDFVIQSSGKGIRMIKINNTEKVL